MPTRTSPTRANPETCVHHWIIEPPDGPTSGARCRLCGEERAFFNNPEAVVDQDRKIRTRPQERDVAASN